jgi:Type I phosphodiesterase / nucleotide pyrophosphatase
MKKNFLFIFLLTLITITTTTAQNGNVVIVTLDGMRWQEVFKGIDETLMNDSVYNHDRKGLHDKFWAATETERRKKLFPFLWSIIAQQGQLYGNRLYKNKVDNANPYWFSYPGYNEIFTGYPDTAVNSNDKIYNKNETVLEFINKQKNYQGKVAAFTTWDVFPYILNEPRSGIYVNADIDTLAFTNPQLSILNDMQFLTTKPIGVRPDVITYMAAREYLKAYQPKVLYIAFDETDDFAHAGMYDQYIGSAHSQDKMIADLWNTLQSMPAYKNNTTLLITSDHGRGDSIKEQWKHHGSKIADAHEIWLAVMGPGIQPRGEIKEPMQLYQKQLAATIAKMLTLNFTTNHPVAPHIYNIFE